MDINAYASILCFALGIAFLIRKRKVVIVGCGLAGLSAAIQSANDGKDVVILDACDTPGGNSMKASTGISAAVDDNDVLVFENDIIRSGRGLCSTKLVRKLAMDSIPALSWLKENGVNVGECILTGGHSVPRTRVITGAEIMKKLMDIAEKHDNIDIRTNIRVTRLVMSDGACKGVYYEDGANAVNGKIVADSVILTTGGYAANSRVMERYGLPTTNGPLTRGDGINISAAIGAEIIHTSQIQVHPTGFIDPAFPDSDVKILAPEKLRSVGGILLDSTENRFVDELDTRDVITENILALVDKTAYLVLDEAAAKRFGKNFGYYMSKGLFKERFIDGQVSYVATVTPVIHYTMGGVRTDEMSRVIDVHGNPVPGLYAAGELIGGIHGKNRLCGTSLLDCIVFGRTAGTNS
ncbi:fumarate reductase [Paramecium bursaria Chlorella virus CZ-2]|nr:fumarate reductase [Paramecium bursaria Chlorella virus CZ-2]